MIDPTRRFSQRVADYARYRPSYPQAIVRLLEADCGLSAEWVVVDLGSGTGLLSQLFLGRGCRVIGIEPNRQMREVGRDLLARYPEFTSLPGRAEETTLGPASADLITAGQAFHWFDPVITRRECERVLRPAGWVMLVWNDRRKEATAFLRDYDRLLLTHGTDYRKVDHTRIGDAELRDFFGPDGHRQACFETRQHLDFEGLRGRLLSSSYVPAEDDPRSAGMIAELRGIFDAHQFDGKVTLEYDTRMSYGRLS